MPFSLCYMLHVFTRYFFCGIKEINGPNRPRLSVGAVL